MHKPHVSADGLEIRAAVRCVVAAVLRFKKSAGGARAQDSDEGSACRVPQPIKLLHHLLQQATRTRVKQAGHIVKQKEKRVCECACACV